MPSVITKKAEDLTLKDLLSRLSPQRAEKLLGPDGRRLIRAGGQYGVNLDTHVYLGDDLFRLSLPGCVVTITTMAEAKGRLRWNCTQCSGACEHVGAAFSVILEEKTYLGLAEIPPERVPVDQLDDDELVEMELRQRAARAAEEKMRIRAADPQTVWTDYYVTSAASGKRYRVALRGWQPGESYCTCPDYRKNTLGTCKHIMNVQRKVKRKFSAAVRNRPYRPDTVAVYLAYGTDLQLRVQVPPDLDPAAAKLVAPLTDAPVDDIHDLLGRIDRLESLGCETVIYPDAEEHIRRLLYEEHIAALVADIRRDPAAHPLRTELLNADVLGYQLDGIAFAVGAGRAILADDMGLGKTIQGIGVAELLAREAGIERVLVISPATLKAQWRGEIVRFADRDCHVVLGSARQRAAQYDTGAFFTVCNYEQVMRDARTVDRVDWDLVILDEGQRIKNWDTKTARAVKSVRSPFALVLTGTPLENRLDDLYSIVEFIDDRRLGPAFRFYNRHRVTNEKGRVIGYRNLDVLREHLAPVLLRRTRKAVLTELPPRSTEVVRITPSKVQKNLNDSYMQTVATIAAKQWISEIDLLRLRSALLMARRAADSAALVDEKHGHASTKLDELARLLEELHAEEGRKIVMFSEWTGMLDLVAPLMARSSIRSVRLDGSVPQQKRKAIIDRFNADAECTVFLTTNAGATGLNLQSADTLINLDLPWNPAVLEQRIARIHRMGQRRPVQVFVLVTTETIEENIMATLSGKYDLAAAALDRDSDIDAVDLVSGIDGLKARLEVLLGARPEAVAEAESELRGDGGGVRREKVAAAGGRLLSAALEFLGEMMPADERPQDGKVAEIKRHLAACVDTGDDGRKQLTVTLPDDGAVDRLAATFAAILSRTDNRATR